MRVDPILTDKDGSIASADCETLVRCLGEGQIVGLPTETCYGLAARADRPEALQRLAQLKGRPEDRAFTWHLGPSQEAGQGLAWGAIRGRLAEGFWPGPLTLVLPAPERWAKENNVSEICHGGRIGLRVPAQSATGTVLDAAPFPVVMTSANPSGATPILDGASMVATFGEAMGAWIDAGQTELGGSSSVLALGPGELNVLRQGKLSLEDLRAQIGLRILFVCTGNTCRSPMAEAIAKHLLSKELSVPANRLTEFGFHVESAGVFASNGAPASNGSIRAVHEMGLELENHQSTPIASAMARGVERIYCLSHSHVAALLDAPFDGPMPAPELLDPTGASIPDPIGGPIEVYRQTREAIAAAIQKRMPEWV